MKSFAASSTYRKEAVNTQGHQWCMLPSDFPKWRTVYACFCQWRAPDQDGISVLEQALKKSGWRGPYQTGAERLDKLFNRGRSEREEHG